MVMKKIIIPTDFSENAQNALNFALELYKNQTCTFFLLHTYTPVIYSYDYQMNVSGYFGELTDTLKENSIQQLERTKRKVKEKFNNPKHNFKVIAAFNLLVDKIKELIEKESIDLVVMGTKGATGAKEILFGSNTIHVIQKIKCPVLAIPDGYFFEEPKNILFPTDYKINYSDKHLETIHNIATLYSSKIHVFHVSNSMPLTVQESTNKSTLHSLLKSKDYTFETTNNQSVDTAIHNYKKETSIQLLMMINNKHSFFENLFFKPIIHKIGFHLDVPFLVIPS